MSDKSTTLESAGPLFQSVGLTAPGMGWAVVEDRLYWSADGGAGWVEITPEELTNGRILGVEFRDESHGLLVGQMDSAIPGEGRLAIGAWVTEDGGRTWGTSRVAEMSFQEAHSVHAAYVEILDEAQAFIVLKLQSGSSFSLGRLFASQDGGFTWEERSVPGGDPVYFLDAERGWMASGPAYDALFKTHDGGWSWERLESFAPGERVAVGLPWFDGASNGWLPVLVGEEASADLWLYSSRDGGESWHRDRSPAPEPAALRAALLDSNPTWIGTVAVPLLDRFGLPLGAAWADFSGGQYGWAVANLGYCQDSPTTSPGSSGQRCTLQSQLLASQDGGSTWEPVCSAALPCAHYFTPSAGGKLPAAGRRDRMVVRNAQ
jgi:photosystem II stability/assembly factor-like uncharacterized protein